jgi:ElaB/YqjD/DUF883 family membrane-anchored ribosome-binding protein
VNTNATMTDSGATASNGATQSEMCNLISDIEEVLGKAAHIVDLDVTKLREGLRQKIAMAKSGLSEGGRRITEVAGTAASATDAYVHRSPWQAVGIAAIAGAAVGFLVARR